MTYILSSATQMDGKGSKEDDISVIFCIDNSLSMGKQEKIKASDDFVQLKGSMNLNGRE